MQRHGTVIIGAGIGGLTAAALLAARGEKVTVLESAAMPGGKIRQIDGVDAGPTVFTMRDVFDEIFDSCGSALSDHVTLRPAKILARHAWGEARLDLFADTQVSEAAIGEFAGAAEACGYRAFRKEAARILDALDAPFMRRGKTSPLGLGWRMGLSGFRDYTTLHPYTSLWSALGKYFTDPRLRQLFARYATYCGSSPFRGPATLMLIAAVEARGVWLIDGGLTALVTALEALARQNGAAFCYDAPVARIIVERGRATGVMLSTGEQLDADTFICNGDVAALAAGAFGDDVRQATRPMPEKRRSLSAMAWTGTATSSGFPLERHNVLFAGDYPAEFAALGAGQLADAPTVYICAQDRTTDTSLGGAERLQLIVNAPARPLSSQEIDRCRTQTQAMLLRSGLSLPLDALTLTTPQDFAARFPSTGGALYGPASHGWAASFRRQGTRTRIPGLYCAGGSTHPGAGVPMAALSGRLAAAAVLADRASTSASTRTAMPGGMSTRSATTAASA